MKRGPNSGNVHPGSPHDTLSSVLQSKKHFTYEVVVGTTQIDGLWESLPEKIV